MARDVDGRDSRKLGLHLTRSSEPRNQQINQTAPGTRSYPAPFYASHVTSLWIYSSSANFRFAHTVRRPADCVDLIIPRYRVCARQRVSTGRVNRGRRRRTDQDPYQISTLKQDHVKRILTRSSFRLQFEYHFRSANNSITLCFCCIQCLHRYCRGLESPDSNVNFISSIRENYYYWPTASPVPRPDDRSFVVSCSALIKINARGNSFRYVRMDYRCSIKWCTSWKL